MIIRKSCEKYYTIVNESDNTFITTRGFSKPLSEISLEYLYTLERGAKAGLTKAINNCNDNISFYKNKLIKYEVGEIELSQEDAADYEVILKRYQDELASLQKCKVKEITLISEYSM